MKALVIINRYYRIHFFKKNIFISDLDWDNAIKFKYDDELGDKLIEVAKLLKNSKFGDARILLYTTNKSNNNKRSRLDDLKSELNSYDGD